MPKEITHWILAREIAHGIEGRETKTVANAVNACPEAFLLGAVAHDGPYYVRNDPRMALAGDRLHGKGVEDGFACVKRIAGSSAAIKRGGSPSSTALAFAAGVLTHIGADIVFHPAVFYFTGFPAHPASRVANSYMYGHWGFEQAMDLHFLKTRGKGAPRRTKTLLGRAMKRSDAGEFLDSVARFYHTDGAGPSRETALAVMRRAGMTQGFLWNPALKLLAKLLNAGRAGTSDDSSAAFYSRRSPWSAWMEGAHPFQDPVTGEERSFDADFFFEKAVNEGRGLLHALEAWIKGSESAFPFPGPRLDTGRPLDEGLPMVHCDPRLLGGAS